MMKLCDYDCGQEAKYQFKNGKWCCSRHFNLCSARRKKTSIEMKEIWKDQNSVFNSELTKNKISKTIKEIWDDPDSIYNSTSFRENRINVTKKVWENPDSGFNSISCKEKKSKSMIKIRKDPNSKFNSELYKEKHRLGIKKAHKGSNNVYNSILFSNKIKLSIKKINKKYPFFSKIEEMRYHPDKLEEKEIQVHCKNHNCQNSKEKDGWFTPTYIQLYERIRQLEKVDGNGGVYLYCSQYCKDTCPLYHLHGDPYKDTNKPYTSTEKEVFNKLVLKRDNEICYYCKEHHATIVHHLRPQKLEPFFALDPDYAISVCKKCHYEKGHPTGSSHSTGNLAKIVCSPESQKFLEQKIN